MDGGAAPGGEKQERDGEEEREGSEVMGLRARRGWQWCRWGWVVGEAASLHVQGPREREMTWRGKCFEEDDLNGETTGTLAKLTEVVETNNFVIFRC